MLSERSGCDLDDTNMHVAIDAASALEIMYMICSPDELHHTHMSAM